MRILIVDDSEMMRDVVRQAIEDNVQGLTLDLVDASNGQEALDAMAAGPVDLIFLDWNMPVLDGLSFVTKIRASGNSTPIVMITSVTDEDRILEAGRAGVNSYIEKPIRGNDLWEQVKEFIK